MRNFHHGNPFLGNFNRGTKHAVKYLPLVAVDKGFIILTSIKVFMKKLLLSILISTPLIALSQGNDPTKTLPRADGFDRTLRTGSPYGGITVHQSTEIQMLSIRFRQENSNVKLKGYKVQIYFGDRGKATEVKNTFSSAYPEVPAEIDYLAPNFRVRVGNFRTNVEAEKFLRQIKGDYNSAYIVPDNISLPGL
jgi:hypothetical protein